MLPMPTGHAVDLVNAHAQQLHIIGMEFRLRDPQEGRTIELALLPMDLWVPRGGYGQGRWSMPNTLHTSDGDIGFQIELG